jgi:hypothetical protein
MKRRQKQNEELRIALQLQGINIVRNRPLPPRQKDPNTYEPEQQARDNLLTLYKPEMVQDILRDLSPTQLEVVNVYWTDIKKLLATKINPSKTIILKIVNKLG